MAEDLNKNFGSDIDPATGNFIVNQNKDTEDIKLKGDFSNDVYDREFQDALRPDQKDASEMTLSPEEIERQCAEIAERYIKDLRTVGSVPVRFCFSGLLEQNLSDGFSKNAFIVDQNRKLLQVDEMMTQNETSSSMTQAAIGEASHKTFSVFHQRQIEILKDYYPEIFDKIAERIRENTGQDISAVNLSVPEEFKRLQLDLRKAVQNLNIKLISPPGGVKSGDSKIDGYEKVLLKNCSSEQKPLVRSVIVNLISGIPIEDWEFEQQELFVDAMAKHFNKNMQGLAEQIYDTEVFLDPSQVLDQEKGYLPGIEYKITAPAESVDGIIALGGVLPESYYVEKIRRIFLKNPSMARPIYSWRRDGSLAWPRKMTHDEVKQFVAEREAQEKLTDGQEVTV